MLGRAVEFELDGRVVSGRADEPIIEVARREGVEIPHLCYSPGLEAVGNCRACVVEIDGERVLAPSCCRAPQPGMKVRTASERAIRSQKLVLELLQADMPERAFTRDNEVDRWSEKLAVGKPRFAARAQPAPDLSHPAIAVNLAACMAVAEQRTLLIDLDPQANASSGCGQSFSTASRKRCSEPTPGLPPQEKISLRTHPAPISWS